MKRLTRLPLNLARAALAIASPPHAGHGQHRARRYASRPLPRPDFVIIGAPKCGTSWLQRALAQHPDIVMVPDEIEYFSLISIFRSTGTSPISPAPLLQARKRPVRRAPLVRRARAIARSSSTGSACSTGLCRTRRSS